MSFFPWKKDKNKKQKEKDKEIGKLIIYFVAVIVKLRKSIISLVMGWTCRTLMPLPSFGLEDQGIDFSLGR